MKFTEIKNEKLIEDVIRKRKGWSDVRAMIEEFVKSNIKMAEVDNSSYSSPAGCTSAIKTSIKSARIGGVDVCTRDGKTYIFRTDK